ncbi:MAG TPA: bifunctional homocysteine S-methyltransferase/methylenetetrahydrofolate reductase [Gaiellales bacterium]|nr:bifunctional homocysteine S-methyltransferase/methylenetetrahydrofolate reductase [Gaiellales bacterium]
MPTVADRLAQDLLVGDGGMGSLVSAAVPGAHCPEEANASHPERVLALHVDFIRAGADLIQTNTYGANPVKLGVHRLEDAFAELNEAGVKIAREAREVAGRDVLIAGSIGPLGTSVEILGGAAADAAARYAEQASLLAGRGVDLLVLETFTSLEELVVAFQAARAGSGLPIVAEVTVQDDGETVTGASGGEVAETLSRLGAAAVGVNCSLGPQSALAGLRAMRGASVPLWVRPNAGLPRYHNGRLLYPDAGEDYFEEFAAQALALGARLIGGCCGTGPAHVAAIRRAVDSGRAPRFAFAERRAGSAPAARPGSAASGLAARLERGEWVVSVELDPPKGANLDRLAAVTEALHRSGRVDVFDVNDNPLARARMSSLMTSALLQQRLGVETIPHLTPRDASVRGLESQLLGAHASGIRNLLAVTGDAPTPGDRGGSDATYQVDAIGLVEIVDALNHGRDRAGKVIDAATAFFVGVAVNPTAEDVGLELERFHRKVAAGARFAMTQVLFDLDPLRRMLDLMGGAPPVPILVGVWPVTSHALALRLHNEVPGITIPRGLLDRFERAGADAAREGVAVAREVYAAAREWTAGAYVVPPFGQPEAVLDVIA